MSTSAMIVEPGTALGAYRIGMRIGEAIATLQKDSVATECFFNQHNPLSGDIVLRAPSLGLNLRFEPVSQRLRVVDVFNVNGVALAYNGTIFAGSATPHTFAAVYHLFGPTFPGKVDMDAQTYMLHYRGITFAFSMPQEFLAAFANSNDMPLELPDGSAPVLQQVLIYRGGDVNKPVLPTSTGPHVKCSASSSHFTVAVNGHQLEAGASVQDVLGELGPPNTVHGKGSPKMQIHALKRGSSKSAAAGMSASTAAAMAHASGMKFNTDYFLNYVDLGMDLLFSGESHTLLKVILHTNFPGHPEFHAYAKCDFELDVAELAAALAGSCTPAAAATAAATATATAPTQVPRSERGKGKRKSKSDSRRNSSQAAAAARSAPSTASGAGAGAGAGTGTGTGTEAGASSITATSKWEDVEAVLGPGGRPMVHTHGLKANPFGSTLFYAYPSAIFEVMKCGYLASVTLFATP